MTDKAVPYPGAPRSPPAKQLEAWRAAVLAYRRVMQTAGDDWRGRIEAVDAYLKVRPEDGLEEAKRQVARAIVWAATHHAAWLWRGVRYRGRGG